MRFILFIGLFIISSNGFSQSIRFNKTYDDFLFPTARNLIENEFGYVLVGGGRDSVGSPNELKIIVSQIDNDGNVLWNKSYGDSLYNYYHGEHLCLKKLSNNNYILAGTRSNNDTRAGLLCLFDENFDTLWMKTYFEDTIVTIFYDCIEAIDGGYVMVGYSTQDLVGGELDYADVIVVKTDVDGNIEWAKRYGGSNLDMGLRIVRSFEGGYLIGGYTRSFEGGADLYRGDWYIVSIDSLGNQLWNQHYGNPDCNDGFLMDILPTSDSAYLFVGAKVVYYDGRNLTKSRIIKFKYGEGVLWDRLYGPITEASAITSIIELEDGSLAGLFHELEWDVVVHLRKLSSEGDTIWKRPYIPSDCDSDRILYTIKQTDDMGFIMSGYCVFSQKIWVVKTDSLGCDSVGGCDYTFISENILPKGKEMVLYPNPASNDVKCSASWRIKCQMLGAVQIYDIQGKKRIEIKDFDLEGEIDVSGLGNGIYFVRINTKNGVVGEKLVIQR